MAGDQRMVLIHAELDGDLDGEQRAVLARLLLADPQARALRDELRTVSNRLGAIEESEPPRELKDSILERLPSTPLAVAARAYRTVSFGRWRIAALIAGLLTAGTIVYESLQGPAPALRETAGTMATDESTAVDSVVIAGGPFAGRATLYRDERGLAVGLEESAKEPIDVLIATGAHSFRINGLGGPAAGSTRRMVALPDVGRRGQGVELSFLIDGRAVSHATLRAASGP